MAPLLVSLVFMTVMEVWRIQCGLKKLFGSNVIFTGSTVAQYTGQTLHHRVVESAHFKEKNYAKALVDAYLKLDVELLQGNVEKWILVSYGVLIEGCLDQNFAYDPSGCTAVTALVTPDQKSIFVVS